ncbi:hypothetical protein AMELA_G00125340 [Ameiurus melas]|uniref:Galectin n=1 Tax=Ameiurus melas TaxID=219545 RepID=A0A7J6AN10_AMEME|nr:hypothetical protein AMELA_G00125340 [Ameiurus melas]
MLLMMLHKAIQVISRRLKGQHGLANPLTLPGLDSLKILLGLGNHTNLGPGNNRACHPGLISQTSQHGLDNPANLMHQVGQDKFHQLPRKMWHCGVYDKLLITIQGEPKPDAKKFSINLAKNRDLALHFNPRFDENGIKVIVRNSLINTVWGNEERTAPSFPFIPGKPFEVKILCTPTDYKVAVNKAHLLEYRHRIHELNQINHLTVLDDVKLTSVNIETLP